MPHYRKYCCKQVFLSGNENAVHEREGMGRPQAICAVICSCRRAGAPVIDYFGKYDAESVGKIILLEGIIHLVRMLENMLGKMVGKDV